MKKHLKLILSAAFLLTTFVGMANEPKLSIVTVNDVNSLVFELELPSSSTTVRFLDVNDHVLYSETISDLFYIKKFNLNNLIDGIYYFETEDDFKSIVYKINLINNDLKIVERTENAKPVFRIVEDKVFLNLLNLDKDKVEIKIEDSLNRVIFKESLNDQVLIKKTFYFENVAEDEYTIVVNDGSTVHYKIIVVE